MTWRATRTVLALLAAEPDPAAVRELTDPDVVEAADRLGILPVIAGVGVRLGRIPDAAAGVAAVLGARRDQLSPTAALLAARHECRRRHEDLVALERRTAELLGDVRTVPLKGAALRRYAIWPDASERPQRDIDLWCPESAAAPIAAALLRGSGYRPATDRPVREVWTDDHHDDPLVLDGLAGSVEVHRHPTIERARSAGVYRLRQTPDGAELTAESIVLHIVVHAQLQDFSYALARLPLVALLDVAYALERGFVSAQQLRNAAGSREAQRAVEFHLYCASRLRGRPPRAAFALRCRWWCAVASLRMPRLAVAQQELMFAPYALSRTMMQRRAGRQLGPAALFRDRVRLLVSRGARAVRRVASSP